MWKAFNSKPKVSESLNHTLSLTNSTVFKPFQNTVFLKPFPTKFLRYLFTLIQKAHF